MYVFNNAEGSQGCYASGQFQPLLADRTFAHKLKQKFEEMQKIVYSINRSKALNIEPFLNSSFNPRELFDSVQELPSVKRRKISEISNTNLISANETPCSSTTYIRNINSSKSLRPKNSHTPYTRNNYSSLKFSKIMNTTTKTIDSVVNKAAKKSFNKITIARSTHYYNRHRIQKLQSTLANITKETAQKHANELKSVTISCEEEYFGKFQALNAKIEELETVNKQQNLKMHELKSRYERLKNDYDYEMDKSNQEILKLAEQINNTEITATFKLFENDLTTAFPEVHMRESFRKLIP